MRCCLITGIDITHQQYFIIDQSTNESHGIISIPYDYVLRASVINISIAEPIIVIEEGSNELLICSIGEPIAFTVYANVCKLFIINMHYVGNLMCFNVFDYSSFRYFPKGSQHGCLNR